MKSLFKLLFFTFLIHSINSMDEPIKLQLEQIQPEEPITNNVPFNQSTANRWCSKNKCVMLQLCGIFAAVGSIITTIILCNSNKCPFKSF